MTFKQILQAAQKNLATDIYLSSSRPIFIKTRNSTKALTPKGVSLNKEQIHQLIEKLTENETQKSKDAHQLVTYYSVPKINLYKVNIHFGDHEQNIHLQVMNKEAPSSEITQTEFLDGYSTIKDGLMLLTGKHQSGLTHTLNSLIYMCSVKNEKLIGTIAKKHPWQHKQINSMINQYNYSDDIHTAIEKALSHNCDFLFIDDLNFKEFESLYPRYTFDRPTFLTLNFESLLQALKTLNKSPLFDIIKNQIQLISHQDLVFSHQITRHIPVFEYTPPSTKLFTLLEDPALLGSLVSLSDLAKKDKDDSLVTKEHYLARMVRKKLISSQQASQMCQDPNTLMRRIATMDEDDKTDIIASDTMVSAPPMQLDQEWTNIENIPIDED